MRRSKSEEENRCGPRLSEDETSGLQKTVQLFGMRVPFVFFEEQPLERGRVQETRHQNRIIGVHDLQGPSEVIPKKITLWAFHSPQVSQKKNLKREVVLQA